MNCDDARLLLPFARPHAGGLDAANTAALDGHLEACTDCAAAAAAERARDAALVAAMRAVDPPADLRQRLHTRLDADNAERRRRLWLRRLYYSGAVAAVLLLTVGGYLGWRYFSRPRFNNYDAWNRVNAEEFRQFTADEVKDLFRQLGMETAVPENFHYDRLTFWGVTLFEGRKVPYLIFQNRQDQASVRILSDRDFNLDALTDDQVLGEGYPKKVQIRWSPDRHYAFLVAYTGDDPSWLMPPPRQAL
jgi:hypothetical protein